MIFVRISSGSPSEINKVASFPSSKEPTFSSIHKISATDKVTARNAAFFGNP